VAVSIARSCEELAGQVAQCEVEDGVSGGKRLTLLLEDPAEVTLVDIKTASIQCEVPASVSGAAECAP
jgi:hypothetical protein